MSKTMFRRLGLGLTFAVLSLALVACGSDNGGDEEKVAVTGASLSTSFIKTAATETTSAVYSEIAVKGLVKSATEAADDDTYIAGGASDTAVVMSLEPGNNDGAVDVLVTLGAATTASDVLAASYSGGMLKFSFPAKEGTTVADVEGKTFNVEVSKTVGENKTVFFTTTAKVVPAGTYVADLSAAMTVADSQAKQADAEKDANVQTVTVTTATTTDTPAVTTYSGSASFAVTLPDVSNPAVIVKTVKGGEGFTTALETATNGDLSFVVYTDVKAGSTATYELTSVAKTAGASGKATVLYLSVKSADPVPSATATDITYYTIGDQTAVSLTFAGGYDTTKHDLFAVSATEAAATVDVTNSDTDADTLVVTTVAVGTSEITLYVVPQGDNNKDKAISSSTFTVTVAETPTLTAADVTTGVTSGTETTLEVATANYDPATMDILASQKETPSDTQAAFSGISVVDDTSDTTATVTYTLTDGATSGNSGTLVITIVPAGETDTTNAIGDAIEVSITTS